MITRGEEFVVVGDGDEVVEEDVDVGEGAEVGSGAMAYESRGGGIGAEWCTTKFFFIFPQCLGIRDSQLWVELVLGEKKCMGAPWHLRLGALGELWTLFQGSA